MGIAIRLLERFKLVTIHRRILKKPLPEKVSYGYCLGGMAFTFFLILAATGMMLTLYYVPSETEAFNSVLKITEDVPLGWLVRSMHKWAASLFIIFILLHTARVFAAKAYRAPREFNWMIGVMILVLSMGSGFTGYLLPWDQKAYWASEVGTSMAGTVPFVGEYLLQFVRGGRDVGAQTLIRFYSAHAFFIPVSIAVLLWMHFHIVRRQGISGRL
ncbi:MAG: cytochrome b N-terminal domain-containing protein [Dissulfurispiraceae bacterium]|jgi:quinol-cytochrome oxidoreductase complex cytochrome b subunit|nr:cytochrome b N-terminal domain-containing protein [Dissulfurispiraceae bacterium]